MGTPATFNEAREEAIEIEREYAGCTADDDDDAYETRSKSTKKVHIVETDNNIIICA